MSEFSSDRCETVETTKTTKTEENAMPTNTAPAAGSSDPTAWRDHDLRCFPRDLHSDKAVVVERYDGVRFVCMPGESACKASWVALHGANELPAATDVRRWRYATSTDTLHPCNDWIVTDAARAALGEPTILNSGGFVSPAQSAPGEPVSRRSAGTSADFTWDVQCRSPLVGTDPEVADELRKAFEVSESSSGQRAKLNLRMPGESSRLTLGAVLVYGAQGCGKGHNAEAIRAHFGCTSILDEWCPGDPVSPGALVLTNLDQARVFGSDLLWKQFEKAIPYSVVAEIMPLPKPASGHDATPAAAIDPDKAVEKLGLHAWHASEFLWKDLNPFSAQELALYSMTVDGYESLADVLRAAYEQAAAGKGKERHANDLPFDAQPMQDLIRMHGLGFATGQASKKASEALSLLTPEHQTAELLGAINYLAGAVIAIKEKAADGKSNKQEGGAE